MKLRLKAELGRPFLSEDKHACAIDRLWGVSPRLAEISATALSERGEPRRAGGQDGEAVEALWGDG